MHAQKLAMNSFKHGSYIAYSLPFLEMTSYKATNEWNNNLPINLAIQVYGSLHEL